MWNSHFFGFHKDFVLQVLTPEVSGGHTSLAQHAPVEIWRRSICHPGNQTMSFTRACKTVGGHLWGETASPGIRNGCWDCWRWFSTHPPLAIQATVVDARSEGLLLHEEEASGSHWRRRADDPSSQQLIDALFHCSQEQTGRRVSPWLSGLSQSFAGSEMTRELVSRKTRQNEWMTEWHQEGFVTITDTLINILYCRHSSSFHGAVTNASQL